MVQNSDLIFQLENATNLLNLSHWCYLHDTVIHQIVFDATEDLARADKWMAHGQYLRDKLTEST